MRIQSVAIVALSLLFLLLVKETGDVDLASSPVYSWIKFINSLEGAALGFGLLLVNPIIVLGLISFFLFPLLVFYVAWKSLSTVCNSFEFYWLFFLGAGLALMYEVILFSTSILTVTRIQLFGFSDGDVNLSLLILMLCGSLFELNRLKMQSADRQALKAPFFGIIAAISWYSIALSSILTP